MYKIESIKLTNFKFFFGSKIISFNRKHVLIYGENGSGKSSIYWALHCFLHSTLKPDVDSVRKYFKHITEHDESLKNRYAGEMDSSAVEVKLSHDNRIQYADIDAKISNIIVNTQSNESIKLMAFSSDLISYKVIYNMYLATNKNSIKLFQYFQDNLMEFINFDQGITTIHGGSISINSLDWWRYIKKGIDPYPGMKDPKYSEFQNHVMLYNQKMSDFLQLITEETNKCLVEDFNEELKIKFRYTPAIYNDFNTHNSGRTRTTIPPEIELIVEILNLRGEAATVERPHSYLNEARLSSIAIAIRFAILKERYIINVPRIMVLDDLLLSLDLGNRSAVLAILLKKYLPLYQLVILTHDRVLFNSVLNHLSEDTIEKDWEIYEMYETEEDGKKVPSIAKYKTLIAKALCYFKGNNCPIDYNACGNYQRQALEDIFKNQFKFFNLCDENGQVLNINYMMINKCLLEAKKLYPKIRFSTIILDELDIHRKQSLNPSSHHNPKSNFYKRELQRTFDIIKILNNHDIRIVVATDSELTFKVLFSGVEHDYKVKILSDILKYKKPDGDYYFIQEDKYDYQMIECDGEVLEHNIKSKSLSELYNTTCEFYDRGLNEKIIRDTNSYNVFKFCERKLSEL